MSTDASIFSPHNPKLQIVWDAHSLGELMFCPWRYSQTIVEGRRPEGSNVHLEFGGLFASAAEMYSKLRLEGKGKEDTTLAVLQWAMENSGNRDEAGVWHPWGGSYEAKWRCTGTEPYRNEKGNKAKCPFSHKGKWFDGEPPQTCGVCGSETETETQWVPEDKVKNRYTLIRLIAAYCDQQPQAPEDGGLWPFAFPDGKPAVELRIPPLPLPILNRYGEPYMLTGYIDRIVTFGDETFIADNKTTKHQLNAAYFSGFQPSVQMDTYDFIGSVVYEALDIQGVIIEAAQVTMSDTDLGFTILRHDDSQRMEFLEDLEYWLGQAEAFAEAGRWPRNRKNCTFCSFKRLCAMPRRSREIHLKGLPRRKWNPLEDR